MKASTGRQNRQCSRTSRALPLPAPTQNPTPSAKWERFFGVALATLAWQCGGRSSLLALESPIADREPSPEASGVLEGDSPGDGEGDAEADTAVLPNGMDGPPVDDAEGGTMGGASEGSAPGDSSAPASCASGGPGMTDCGSDGSGDCCVSTTIEGGTFFRSYESRDGGGAVGRAHPATVSSLRLDEYEVTVGRFRKFVAAWKSGYRPPPGAGKHDALNGGDGVNATGGGFESGWDTAYDASVAPTDANLTCGPANVVTWTASPGDQERAPISCINWSEAYAFCIWDGGFLPTEAEWEYAAAGGASLREYPWGATAPGTGASYAIYDCYYPGDGSCHAAPVGSAPLGAGTWGQFDLAGNVMEWTLDYEASYVDPCVDCANLSAGGERAVRGGNFLDPATVLLPPIRSAEAPQSRVSAVGFRCARNP
jgi:sulfatase modifying factor 1